MRVELGYPKSRLSRRWPHPQAAQQAAQHAPQQAARHGAQQAAQETAQSPAAPLSCSRCDATQSRRALKRMADGTSSLATFFNFTMQIAAAPSDFRTPKWSPCASLHIPKRQQICSRSNALSYTQEEARVRAFSKYRNCDTLQGVKRPYHGTGHTRPVQGFHIVASPSTKCNPSRLATQ